MFLTSYVDIMKTPVSNQEQLGTDLNVSMVIPGG